MDDAAPWRKAVWLPSSLTNVYISGLLAIAPNYLPSLAGQPVRRPALCSWRRGERSQAGGGGELVAWLGRWGGVRVCDDNVVSKHGV